MSSCNRALLGQPIDVHNYKAIPLSTTNQGRPRKVKQFYLVSEADDVKHFHTTIQIYLLHRSDTYKVLLMRAMMKLVNIQKQDNRWNKIVRCTRVDP